MRFSIRQSDDEHKLPHVLKDDHTVVERKTQIRQVPIISGTIRKVFGVPNHVVCRESDSATGKPRKSRNVYRTVAGQKLVQFLQRVFAFPLVNSPITFTNGDLPTTSRQ